MPAPNYGMADLGLICFAFLGWWFWIICAIVARRVAYVVWAFWWVGLMWWLAVAITPTQTDPAIVLVGLSVWALLLAAWPIRAAYKRMYLAE
jgi:hypothetical protein